MDPEKVNLYMIYSALESEGLSSLIGIHKCSERKCPVAKNIHQVLMQPYKKIEDAVKKSMEEISLKTMINDFHKLYPDYQTYNINDTLK